MGGIVVLSLLFLSFVIFVTKVVVTLFLYTFPFIIIFMFVFSWRVNWIVELGEPADFDDPKLFYEIEILKKNRQKAAVFVSEQYRIGRRNDLFLTAKSDETLFHAGSRLGKALNAKIQEGVLEIETISSEIKNSAQSIIENFPDWRWFIEKMMRKKRMFHTLMLGVLVFIFSYISIESFGVFPKNTLNNIDDFFMWEAPVKISRAQLFLSSTFSLSLMTLCWFALPQRPEKFVKADQMKAWSELEGKWYGLIREEYFDFHHDCDADFDDDSKNTENIRHWYDVLGIDPDASLDEIKNSYRELIKQYHPDKVASLGPLLKELANKESRKINEAYVEAIKVIKSK